MNLARKILIAGIVLATESSWTTCAPRLWEVKGRNDAGEETKFHILAVSHNGLDEEYDDYLSRVVVPRAMRASAFLDESAVLSVGDAPACPTPLANTPENAAILDKARADAARAEFDLLPALP